MDECIQPQYLDGMAKIRTHILPPIEAANLGNPANWWVKIRGGFIIQGGFYAINSTANKETPFTVAFPIAFSTTCMGICGNDVGSGVFALSFNPISNALFNVWRGGNRPTTFRYTAFGF